MQQTDEHQAYELLTSKISSFKGKLTVSDAAAITGLAIHEAKDALNILMNKYMCKLQVAESGEIIYSFGSSLRRRGEKSLTDYMEQLGDLLWKTFKALFKVWITVMLIVYFVIFVVIVIAMIIGASSGRGGKGKIKLGWVADLFADLFTAAARTGMYVYATDSQGYRHRSYVQTRRKNKSEPEQKKRLMQSVYDYVFGPPRSEFDPLANAKEAAAYLRTAKGILTTSEVVALAGYSFSEAEEKITDYLTRFQGRPEITDDGVVYGKFMELLRSGGTSAEETNVELFWNEYEAPYVVTGNTSGRNTFITFANGFNLVLSLMFLSGGTELSYGDQTLSGGTISIILGWIPCIFSALFFLVPLIRSMKVRRLERKRREKNIKRRIVRVIYETRGYDLTVNDLIASVTRGPEEKLSQQAVEKYLNMLLIELQGESNPDEQGKVKYSFPRIAREYETVEKIRRETTLDDSAMGKIILEN